MSKDTPFEITEENIVDYIEGLLSIKLSRTAKPPTHMIINSRTAYHKLETILCRCMGATAKLTGNFTTLKSINVNGTKLMIIKTDDIDENQIEIL